MVCFDRASCKYGKQRRTAMNLFAPLLLHGMAAYNTDDSIRQTEEGAEMVKKINRGLPASTLQLIQIITQCNLPSLNTTCLHSIQLAFTQPNLPSLFTTCRHSIQLAITEHDLLDGFTIESRPTPVHGRRCVCLTSYKSLTRSRKSIS